MTWPTGARLSRNHRLIRYDERGNGLSDWKVGELSLNAFVMDLETVVDAAEMDRFALLGISQGCAVSVAYAVRHPERVSHLILHGGYSRGWKGRGSSEEQERRRAMQTLARQGWGQDNPPYRELFTSLYVPGATREEMDWFNDLQRVSASPERSGTRSSRDRFSRTRRSITRRRSSPRCGKRTARASSTVISNPRTSSSPPAER